MARQSLQGDLHFHLGIRADGGQIFNGCNRVVRVSSQGLRGQGLSLRLGYLYLLHRNLKEFKKRTFAPLCCECEPLEYEIVDVGLTRSDFLRLSN